MKTSFKVRKSLFKGNEKLFGTLEELAQGMKSSFKVMERSKWERCQQIGAIDPPWLSSLNTNSLVAVGEITSRLASYKTRHGVGLVHSEPHVITDWQLMKLKRTPKLTKEMNFCNVHSGRFRVWSQVVCRNWKSLIINFDSEKGFKCIKETQSALYFWTSFT